MYVYVSEMILHPAPVQNHFGQVQIIKISPELTNLTKTIWTWPKLFGTDKNDLDLTRTIFIRQKQFGRSKIILDV